MRTGLKLLLLTLLLPLAACSSAPLGYLDAAGPAARGIAKLGWGLLWLSIIVCVAIAVLLAIAIWRPRRPDYRLRGQVGEAVAIRWIEGGVALSVVLLAGAAVWTLWTAGVISASAPADVQIDVIGHQWWWEARYRSDVPAREFTTANQLIIPAGKRVEIRLSSADVIHSFWVPKLGGKMDMIPGRYNVTWIEADKAGVYQGQCTEFCGLQHAHMAFTVNAFDEHAFEAWWQHQLQPAESTQSHGQSLFQQSCGACHRVRGIDAGGIVGPDLSHFGARPTIAAGALTNDEANLAYWINHTQEVKPGARMPEIGLSDEDAKAVAQYLEGLK